MEHNLTFIYTKKETQSYRAFYICLSIRLLPGSFVANSYFIYIFVCLLNMEPELKRKRTEELLPASEKQFLDLNYDCLSKIFHFLLPADLCSVQFTCKHLQNLAFDHFRRLFPEIFNTILIKRGKSLKVSEHEERHLKYFSKCFSKLVVYGEQVQIKHFKFIKSNCSTELKILDISSNARLYPDDGNIINDQLQGLESLILRGEFKQANLLDKVLLRHCVNLKQLTIDDINLNNITCSSNCYPKLKSFNIQPYTFTQRGGACAGNLVRNNPQINEISCSGISFVRNILQNVTDKKLERLIIAVKSDDLTEAIHVLTQFCSNHYEIDYLEFNFCGKVNLIWIGETSLELKMLRILNAIQPIHGLRVFTEQQGELNNRIISVITYFNHLKKLEMEITGYKVFPISDLTNVLTKEMVHLENLSLFLQGFQKIAGETYLTPFVRFAERMEFSTFKVNHQSALQFNMDSNDLNELAAIRSSVGGGSMKIHTIGESPKRMPSRKIVTKNKMLTVTISIGTYD